MLLEYEHKEGETELELEFKWSAPDKKPRPGKFELYQSASDQWYFRLKAPNGEIILSSEGYASKQGAANSIESVQKNAQPENIEHRTSKAGQPYFVLKAANNQIIGTSQMYKRKSSANKGAQSIINYAPAATTTEE
ncbi:MAG: YegP family protein [Chloroflexi bacterium]|nr:YegP family protein [Chloroflexota bacterium]